LSRNADALLAVDALARRKVLGEKEILFSTAHEDASVAMCLNDDLATALLA
jgi:hypothetical protein